MGSCTRAFRGGHTYMAKGDRKGGQGRRKGSIDRKIRRQPTRILRSAQLAIPSRALRAFLPPPRNTQEYSNTEHTQTHKHTHTSIVCTEHTLWRKQSRRCGGKGRGGTVALSRTLTNLSAYMRRPHYNTAQKFHGTPCTLDEVQPFHRARQGALQARH